MPRLGYMIVDGMALVLVAVGLTAVIVGYERNLPAPVEQQVAQVSSDWEEPENHGGDHPEVQGGSSWTGRAAERGEGRGGEAVLDPRPEGLDRPTTSVIGLI